MKTQKGFSVIEGLLIFVIVGMLAGIGWYVFDSQRKTNGLYDDIAYKSSAETKANIYETKDWLIYEQPSKQYKLKIPDGWNLGTRKGDLYGRETKFIEFNSGTKATVIDVEEGDEHLCSYPCAFSLQAITKQMINYNDNPGELEGVGTMPSFKTNSGLEVKKFYFVQDKHPTNTGSNPDNYDIPYGTTEYIYYIRGDNIRIIVVHDELAGQPNIVPLIETAIKTIEVE